MTRLEMISGVLPRKELVMKELESLLRVGVPKKLRFGDCTLLRMSMDCLSRQSKGDGMRDSSGVIVQYIPRKKAGRVTVE